MDKTVFLWEIRAGLHSVEMSSKTRSPFLRENQNSKPVKLAKWHHSVEKSSKTRSPFLREN